MRRLSRLKRLWLTWHLGSEAAKAAAAGHGAGAKT